MTKVLTPVKVSKLMLKLSSFQEKLSVLCTFHKSKLYLGGLTRF